MPDWMVITSNWTLIPSNRQVVEARMMEAETRPGRSRISETPWSEWSRLGESNPRPTHYECVALAD